MHDQHHHLREQFSAERENILAHTRRISHFDQIGADQGLPGSGASCWPGSTGVKAHLLLKRIGTARALTPAVKGLPRAGLFHG